MRCKTSQPIAWIAALLIASSSAATAQLQTGSLYGIVLDP